MRACLCLNCGGLAGSRGAADTGVGVVPRDGLERIVIIVVIVR